MEYNQFIVKSFERRPGKWRATVRRSDGKPIMVVGRVKLSEFVTGIDATTAEAALLAAFAAIDAGSLNQSHRPDRADVRSRTRRTRKRADRRLSFRLHRPRLTAHGRDARANSNDAAITPVMDRTRKAVHRPRYVAPQCSASSFLVNFPAMPLSLSPGCNFSS